MPKLVNTRDCPELFDAKKNAKHKFHVEDSSTYNDCQDHESARASHSTAQLLEMFPLFTQEQIDEALTKRGFENGLQYLTDQAGRLEQEYQEKRAFLSRKKKTSSSSRDIDLSDSPQSTDKKFSLQHVAFPKLSAEREWEMVDEQEIWDDEWETVESMEKKATWAERVKKAEGGKCKK